MTGMERNLLPGPSSFALTRAFLIYAPIPLGLMAVCLLLIAVGLPGSWFTTSIVAVWALSGVAWISCWPWSDVKQRQEARAGYTTWPRLHQELEQRDPYLGKVIRPPGEDFLEWPEFRAVCKEARAAAKASSTGRTPPLPR